jgi:hypothetical protein
MARLRSTDLEPLSARSIAPVKEARALLAEYLELRDLLCSIPSAAGSEASGDDDGALWRRTQAGEAKRARFRRLARLWWKVLDADERALFEYLSRPIGTAQRIVEVAAGALVELDRSGIEVLGLQRRFDGKILQAGYGRIFVSEPRPVYPTHQQAAEQLGLSERQVRTRVQHIFDKVRAEAATWR